LIQKDQMDPAQPTPLDYFKAVFLSVPDQVNPVVFGGRVLAYLLFFVWGWMFILHSVESNYVAESFMHNINLIFHEAGHLIFSPFGKFISTLGGSLSQLLMPAIVAGAFLLKNRDPFGASVGLWWLGQNCMDLAPYLNDARSMTLPLLGGVTGQDVADYHDWEYLLRHLHLLEADHFLAHSAQACGVMLMLIAFVWGGYILFRQFQSVDAAMTRN
jgi:hypothetical protein